VVRVSYIQLTKPPVYVLGGAQQLSYYPIIPLDSAALHAQDDDRRFSSAGCPSPRVPWSFLARSILQSPPLQRQTFS
jgi:hypothetical protein